MLRMRLAVFMLIWFSSSAHAAITVVAQYRLGESDPGALPANIGGNPTLPAVGAVALARSGSPFYSAQRPPLIDSTLSMAFAGGSDRYTGAIVTAAADNFGIEAWVKSNGSTALNAALAYNGNTGNSGWGLFRAGAQYGFLYGGVALVPVAPISIDWMHLALVRDGGTTRFFVNGLQVHSSTSVPRVPAGGFMIGGNPNVANEGFDGLIDEVRVFTFAPGAFVPADLNIVFPSPKQVPVGSRLGAGLMLALMLLLGGVALRRSGA